MRYCARYKQFKYCNYHQSITAGHCDVYPGNNFIPEVSRSNYTTPKYAERVHKLGSPGRTQNQHMTTSRQMFYNLEKDPFEIENIVNQRSEREIIDEISKWAEAQIGRPVLPIGEYCHTKQNIFMSYFSWCHQRSVSKHCPPCG